jgi:hypothetical protein
MPICLLLVLLISTIVASARLQHRRSVLPPPTKKYGKYASPHEIFAAAHRCMTHGPGAVQWDRSERRQAWVRS